MYQNMLRNQMTPLGWTLNLELGTGQLGRCCCWALKEIVFQEKLVAKCQLWPLFGTYCHTNPTRPTSFSLSSTPSFIPWHFLLLLRYCGLHRFWVGYSSTSLSVCFYFAFQSHHLLQSLTPQLYCTSFLSFAEFLAFVSNAQNVQEAHSPLFSGSTKSRSQITSSRGCRTARAATMLSRRDSLIMKWLHYQDRKYNAMGWGHWDVVFWT